MQRTLKQDISFEGTGLHSGRHVRVTMRPAASDHGIIFRRIDADDTHNVIPALWHHVVDTRLCTMIGNQAGLTVGTIEHLMAALRGCGVDNVVIDIDGPEVPVMDGSSAPFVEMIEETGTQAQSAPRRAIRVLKEISVEQDGKSVSLSPSVIPVYAGQIHYDHPDIGTQRYELRLVNGNFKHDVSDCRTFGFLNEVEAMRAAGLALGGSLENAVVLDDDRVLNPEGLRCTDEFIRHKILDAVGDLYLAGGHLLAAYEGDRGGHALNNALLHKLFEDRSAWEKVDLFFDIEEGDTRLYAPGPRATSVAVA